MKKYFVAVALIASSCLASAGAITDYTLNGDVVSNSVTGQQWLQWDETVGKSIDWFINDAEAQSLRDEGWQIASNLDMANLFNDFGFGSLTWDTDENTRQSKFTGSDGVIELASDPELIFIGLFGDTYLAGNYKYDIPTSQARFGYDADSDGLYNWARVQDDHLHPIDLNNFSEGLVQLAWDEGAIDWSLDRSGLALVKATSVSEPTSLMLLLLGLGALIRRRS
jgi:hypothetical protein